MLYRKASHSHPQEITVTVALALFAAATGQGTQDSRVMYDAIVRGWAAGPVGVMDELAREGITTERVDRIADLEDDVENLKGQTEQDAEHIDELEREIAQDDETIEALREEIENLRAQLTVATGEQPEPPTCRRCKREAHGWPVERGDRCAPKSWARCIRDPKVVTAENAARNAA